MADPRKVTKRVCLFLFIVTGYVSQVESGKDDPYFIHPTNPYPDALVGTVTDDTETMVPLVQLQAEPNRDLDEYPVYYYIKKYITRPNNNRPYPFWLDQETGWLYTNENPGLNYDDVSQYRLEYCAVNARNKKTCGDGLNNGANYGNKEWIVINVIPVKYPPVWVNIPSNISLYENIPYTTVYTAEAYDPDVKRRGEILKYKIKSSNPAGAPFTIDLLSGEITQVGTLDYEAQTFYTLNLEVTDGTDTITGTFDIAVLNINEQPTISNVPTYVIELEEQVGVYTFQFTVGMTDPENNPLTVTMTCDPPTCPFVMDAAYGVYLDDSVGILDYEQETTFTMTFTISDGYLTDTAVCTAYIQDINEPPVFTDVPTRLTVMEDEVFGHWLDQVHVADVENDVITYYMMVNPTDNAGFAIDADGIISFTTNPLFDYERTPQYTLTVLATDGATMIGPRTIIVDVIDVYEAPVIMNLPATVDLVEDMVQPSDIFQVVVVDQDANDKLNYSILTSPLGGNGKFEIDQNGLISVVFAPGLDYETMPTYSMLVTVIDQGGMSDEKILTLNVANVPEPPVFGTPDVALIVNEEMTIGDAVPVNIMATDSDIGDVITYTLMATPNSGDFTLDTTGISPVLRYATSLDYDTATLPVFHNIKIVATDLSGKTDVMSVDFTYLDINDNTPVFTSTLYTATIPENLPAGGYVLTVTATDADIHYNKLYYTVDPAFPDTAYFSLDPSSGEVTVAVPPDFEQRTSFTFDVLVTDNGGLTARTNVRVTVTDRNDNPPYLLKTFYNVELWDTAPAGLVIGQVQAADIDTVSTSMEYHMLDPSGLYQIDATTGVMSVRDTTDFEDGQSFTLEVTATDNVYMGTTLRSTSAIIRADTYETCSHHVTVSINSPPSVFASATVRQGLESSLSRMFSSGLARIQMLNGEGVQNGTYLGATTNMTLAFLKDGSSLPLSMIGRVDKEFLTVTEMMEVMEDSSVDNLPSKTLRNALAGYSLSAVFVSSPCPVPPPRFWTETAGGIALQSVLAVLGVLLASAALILLMNRFLGQPLFGMPLNCCKAPAPVRPPVADHIEDFRYNPRDKAQLFRKNKAPPRAGSLESLTDVGGSTVRPNGGPADAWKAKY